MFVDVKNFFSNETKKEIIDKLNEFYFDIDGTKDGDEFYQDISEAFAAKLLSELRYGAIELNGWKVIARQYGSESGNEFDYFMYSAFNPDKKYEKTIKVESYQ